MFGGVTITLGIGPHSSLFVICVFFVSASNISGTAERICAIFTGKTCLVLAQTSLNVKVKGQGHQGQKTSSVLPSHRAAYKWYAIAANSVQQQWMVPFHRCWG